MYIIHPYIKRKCKEIKFLKKFNFLFYLILISFLFIPSKLKSQNFFPVSHETGYYQTDSLFFEVFQGDWDPNLYELQWSVNRFTEESFVPYSGGVWLKDRSYTENTWENVHMINAGSDGSVSITFTGSGLNGVSVFGNNKNPEGFKIRLIAVSDTSFNAYQLLPDTIQLIESGVTPKSLGGEPPYIIDTEDGWFIQFESGNGYTVGNYWEITVNAFIENTKTCGLDSDFTQPRGSLKKVNTIRIRLVQKSTKKVFQQEVTIIGFGKQPHGHHILFATADSGDVLDVLGATSDDDIRKNIYLHILNPDEIVEFEGVVEWDKAAGSSSCLPNTGVAFKARGELGAKNMTTSVFGTLDEKVDKIKMRVGGNGQYGHYSGHEINLQIINCIELIPTGGIRNSIATWYLNGSYWSLGFPQEQFRKRFYERVLNINKDSLDVLITIPFTLYAHSYYSGNQNEEKGWFVVFDKESIEKLGIKDSVVFFPLSTANIEEILKVYQPLKNKFLMVGVIKDGNGIYFQQKLERFLSEEEQNKIDVLNKYFNIDEWLKLISIIHYFNQGDVLSNNTGLMTSEKYKISPYINDFDGGTLSSFNMSDWSSIFRRGQPTIEGYYGFLHYIMDNIHATTLTMQRLALVYQDLLNTVFLPSRTVPIVEKMRSAVMPHYEEFHQSWGGEPNGGHSQKKQEDLYEFLNKFFINRTEKAFHLMADYVLADYGFVNDDRNVVNIVFDSIPEGIVEVKFNSLTLYENFSGLYFPKPQVEVSYVVKGGYSVYIKEYPMFSDSFTLGADSTLNITFVMRKDSVVNSLEEGWNPPLEIYPNPVQHELFINGLFESNLSYSIVSALGSVVVDQLPLHSQNIPVDFLPVGSYFLRVEKGNDFVVKKFVKN